MRLRLCVLSLLLVPYQVFGASKEIQELQRDMADLLQQLRTLQTNTDLKLAALTEVVRETLSVSKAANTAVTVLDTRVNEKLEKQLAAVGQPAAIVGSKVDQMSSDFQSMREAMNDVVSRMGKLEQKLVDLNNTIRTIQAPPTPPQVGVTGAGGGPPPPADTLFNDAQRDQMGGRPELALKNFNDYMQLYGDTDKAPDALYAIGKIHYDQNDFPSAYKDFDAVLERYSDSKKTPDAMLMKGRTLVKMGRRDDGAKEFRMLLAKYPRHETASLACSELKALGFNCSAGAAPMKKKKARA